jgi:threonine aldolase
MQNAIRIRKILGGGMRQIGYLAAAGLYALDHHFIRLKDDHDKAKDIGKALQNQSWIKKVEPIETNIVIFELNDDINETTFLNKLKDKQIYIIGMGSNKLRMVTHLDYTDAMHELFLKTIHSI